MHSSLTALNIVSTKVDTRVNEENVKGNQIENDADNYQLNFNEAAVFCWI